MNDRQPTPRVSIILPTYNRALLIMDTIRSVMDQSYANWELIIVDDGSDDDTESLLAQLQDPRIHFYKAGRIGKNGRVKNIGLSKASGDLIAFIDSDDLWAPSKLEKQVMALQQYPDAGFSLTGGYNFRQPGEPLAYFYRQRQGARYDNVFYSLFRSEVAALTPTLMCRKQCLGYTGLFNENKAFADGDFIVNLARHFKAVILYEPLFYRRLHEGNDSDAHWIKRCDEGIDRIVNYRKEKLLPGSIAREALFKLHINFGENYIRYREYGKAVKKFFRAWQTKPYSIVPWKKTAKAILYALRK
jgi:glycosyltransferase involved in cell wall biosynthesis